MRRTSSVFNISRPASVFSEKETDNSSLSGSTRGREPSTLNSPSLPSVVTHLRADSQESDVHAAFRAPSPLINSYEMDLHTLSPSVEETGYISPAIDSIFGDPGAFTDEPDELPQPDITQDPHVVAPYFVEPMVESIKDFDHTDNTAEFSEAVHGNANVIFHDPSTDSIAASERDTDNASLSSSSTRVREHFTLSSPPLPMILESPLHEAAAEAQESLGPSPLITSSEMVPPTLSPSVEEIQSPTGYIPPAIIDSTVGNPGAFTDEPDELPQPDFAQDLHAFGPVEPHVEPATLNPPRPAEPETIITEALVDEPIPYSVEPMEESIKDFETVDHVDNTAEFSESAHGNANVISPDPFVDTIATEITQPVLDMPQYVNLGLPTSLTPS